MEVETPALRLAETVETEAKGTAAIGVPALPSRMRQTPPPGARQCWSPPGLLEERRSAQAFVQEKSERGGLSMSCSSAQSARRGVWEGQGCIAHPRPPRGGTPRVGKRCLPNNPSGV